MSDMIQRRELAKLREPCKKYEPLSPTRDAFVMSADGKTLILRMIMRGEAEQHGMEGLDPHTAYAYANRLANLDAIEDAALQMQRDRSVLLRDIRKLMLSLQNKKMPADRDIAQMAATIRDVMD